MNGLEVDDIEVIGSLCEVSGVDITSPFIHTIQSVEEAWEVTHNKLLIAQLENIQMKNTLETMLRHYKRNGKLENSAVELDFMPQIEKLVGG